MEFICYFRLWFIMIIDKHVFGDSKAFTEKKTANGLMIIYLMTAESKYGINMKRTLHQRVWSFSVRCTTVQRLLGFARCVLVVVNESAED